jgi:hypothetical protein
MAFERVAGYRIIDSENKNESIVPEESESWLCMPDEGERKRDRKSREGEEQKYLLKLAAT